MPHSDSFSKKLDLKNDFHQVLYPFLKDISEDVDPTVKFPMNLELSGLSDKKITRSGKAPRGRFDKVIETVYSDPWCSFRMKLMDTNELLVRLENVFVCHDRRWTRRSGGKTKFKRKKKWRKDVIITFSLAPEPDQTEWNSDLIEETSRTEKIKLKAKNDRECCQFTRKYKFKARIRSLQNPSNPGF